MNMAGNIGFGTTKVPTVARHIKASFQFKKSWAQVEWGTLFKQGVYVRTIRKIENSIGKDLPTAVVLMVHCVEDGANGTVWVVCSSKKYGTWKIRPGDLEIGRAHV